METTLLYNPKTDKTYKLVYKNGIGTHYASVLENDTNIFIKTIKINVWYDNKIILKKTRIRELIGAVQVV